ncbi:MAG: diaminopimelate epimerase [Actinobacteria bacterium]|nr:MAG: diaminopimelate epimerase [Actinomycetota bacterium]
MQFVKAHGAGNDFVLLEDLDDALRPNPAFVAAVCDRHFGVGADGLIRIVRAPDADFFMDYYNADGEVAEMCGNGIRCLAKYVADRGLWAGDELRVDTRDGVKRITVEHDGSGSVVRARVDMGAPILERGQIPMTGTGDPLHEQLVVAATPLEAACVSMGNPHAVVFVEDLAAVPFETLGPALETNETFPAKTNAEFAQVLNDHEVRMRVWERGVGETMACGTGACAVAVVANLRGYTGRTVAIHVPGGTLYIEWTADGHVYMSGPAEESFEGTLGARLTSLLPQTTSTKG